MKFEVEVRAENSKFPTIYAWWFDSEGRDKRRFEGREDFTVEVKINDEVVLVQSSTPKVKKDG